MQIELEMQRLRPEEFIALRSLLKSDCRLDDGLHWKEGRRWMVVSRNSATWHEAFEVVERLVLIGFVEKGCRTCCANHWGQAVWRLTPRGMEFIRKANMAKVQSKPRPGRPQRGLLSHWVRRIQWLFKLTLKGN